jgi:hypothetical protein
MTDRCDQALHLSPGKHQVRDLPGIEDKAGAREQELHLTWADGLDGHGRNCRHANRTPLERSETLVSRIHRGKQRCSSFLHNRVNSLPVLPIEHMQVLEMRHYRDPVPGRGWTAQLYGETVIFSSGQTSVHQRLGAQRFDEVDDQVQTCPQFQMLRPDTDGNGITVLAGATAADKR